MVKNIDYYDYWNKSRQKRGYLLDREKRALDMIFRVSNKDSSFIDLGCGNGDFISLVKSRTGISETFGIDFSESEVKEAKFKKLNVIRGNFDEEGVRAEKGKFDIAHASEIIEHLYNPDLFVKGINRCLKTGGYLIVATPNLCAWFNRILILTGTQPLFVEISTKSKLVGSGFLTKFKKESQPVGHVRIFTLSALKDILKMYGFEIVETKGVMYDEGLPKIVWPLDKFFTMVSPNISSGIAVLARKIKNCD